MKKNTLLAALGLCLLAFLFYDASGGVGAVQNANRTGSPGSSAGCNACHGGGNYNAAISVEVLDGETPVTAYEPGQKYTFKVTINAENNPAGYGFQSVAMVAADNSNAGSFGEAPTGTDVVTLNNLQLFEHAQRSAENSWSIEWTAPAAGTGDVQIYAAGNAVNGGGTSGDSPTSLENPLVLTENVASSLAAIERLDLNMNVYPNPVRDQLNIQITGAENGRYQWGLFNKHGQRLRADQIEVIDGRADRLIPVADLPAGAYLLRLHNGRGVQTTLVAKE